MLVPSWDDWDALPQLRAFILEGLRWRPVTPLGILSEPFRELHG